MTSFLINKSGLDSVTLEFTTTGSSECTATLQHELLDAKKSYVFAVEHLNVPLGGAPIQKDQPIELFTILKRNVGTNLNGGGANPYLNTAPPQAFVCSLTQPHYTVNGALDEINSFW